MTASQSPSMRAAKLDEDPWEPLTRAQLLDMLGMVELFVKRGKTDLALKQVAFLVDAVELDLALDQMRVARDYGCSEAFLRQ